MLQIGKTMKSSGAWSFSERYLSPDENTIPLRDGTPEMTEREFTSFWDRNADERSSAAASFEHFARVMARRNEYVAEEAYSHSIISVWNRFQNGLLLEEIRDFERVYAFTCVRTHVMKCYRDTPRRNTSGLG